MILTDTQLNSTRDRSAESHLDPVAWRIVYYDATSGAFLIERGGTEEMALATVPSVDVEPAPERYVDHHGQRRPLTAKLLPEAPSCAMLQGAQPSDRHRDQVPQERADASSNRYRYAPCEPLC